MKTVFELLGRVSLSLIFLLSCVNKILNWDASHDFLVGGLSSWQGHAADVIQIQQVVQFLLPLTPLLLIIGTLFEGVGGLLILLGIKSKLGATLLILFLIPATLIFHPFWAIQGPDRELQMILFLKNLAIFGGLCLMMASQGKGGKP